jgi:hypothetical protein
MSYEAEHGPTDISLMIPRRPRDPMSEPVEGIKRPDSPIDLPPGPSQPAKTQSPGLNRPRKHFHSCLALVRILSSRVGVSDGPATAHIGGQIGTSTSELGGRLRAFSIVRQADHVPPHFIRYCCCYCSVYFKRTPDRHLRYHAYLWNLVSIARHSQAAWRSARSLYPFCNYHT